MRDLTKTEDDITLVQHRGVLADGKADIDLIVPHNRTLCAAVLLDFTG